MKKSFLFLTIIFVLLSANSVFAQFENPTYSAKYVEQQEKMLENLDTLFPRLLFRETYDYNSGPDVSQHDGFSFSTQDRSGHRELTITAYQVSDSYDYNLGWDLFNTTGSYENFYLHIDVQLIEQDESNSGYCWFQYTNVDVVGKDKRCSATIYFPEYINTYITKPTNTEYTTRYVLDEYENDYDQHTLEVIRLNGYTSIFIDRHFVVGFEDGFNSRFSHMYGVGLNPGGEYATYAFDNFIIRRQ